MNNVQEDLFFLGIKALIFNKEGKLLLLKKCRKGREPFWELPGGRIQKGEVIEEALKREIFEETSLDIIPKEHVITEVLKIRVPIQEIDYGLILSVYRCDMVQETSVILSHEHVDYQWINTEEVETFRLPFSQEFIKQLTLYTALSFPNKLVRDKIPEIIESEGNICNTLKVEGEDLKSKLLEKLQEEIAEFTLDPCVEEMADILEVLHGLCDTYSLSFDKIEEARKEKLEIKGGFKTGMVLLKNLSISKK